MTCILAERRCLTILNCECKHVSIFRLHLIRKYSLVRVSALITDVCGVNVKAYKKRENWVNGTICVKRYESRQPMIIAHDNNLVVFSYVSIDISDNSTVCICKSFIQGRIQNPVKCLAQRVLWWLLIVNCFCFCFFTLIYSVFRLHFELLCSIFAKHLHSTF